MAKRLNLPEDEIVSMYVSGISENVIAKHFNTSRITIGKRLIAAGIRRRTQSESEALKWSQMSPAQRANQVAAAHKASTGRVASFAERCRIAETREKRQTHVAPVEYILWGRLRQHGLNPIQQKAIGPYNCDLAVHPVAVEVWGGNWHWHGKHRRMFEKRCRYILNAGWSIYILPVSRRDPFSEARVRDLVAYIKAARRDPPSPCEYRMVWSRGEWETVGWDDGDKLVIDPPFCGSRDRATGRYIRVTR